MLYYQIVTKPKQSGEKQDELISLKNIYMKKRNTNQTPAGKKNGRVPTKKMK